MYPACSLSTVWNPCSFPPYIGGKNPRKCFDIDIDSVVNGSGIPDIFSSMIPLLTRTPFPPCFFTNGAVSATFIPNQRFGISKTNPNGWILPRQIRQLFRRHFSALSIFLGNFIILAKKTAEIAAKSARRENPCPRVKMV
jgi:hypothetical protein